MKTLVVGGAGFVGLNIVERLLGDDRDVVIFDRQPPPEAARLAFAELPGRLETVTGDVCDEAAIRDVVAPGLDAIVLGAAITADAERDARDPATILRVNLMSQVPMLERARAVRVRRVVNLSSTAAYGRAGEREPLLREETAADPATLYAITKFASERVAERLGGLWGLDVVSVRLSGVFGRWERATGVRDTLSPQWQVAMAARRGTPALMDRPGLRDWIYASDVAEAVVRLVDADAPAHRLYNISNPHPWTVLDWGRHLARDVPGFECRLAKPGETPTISLHGSVDRAPLDTTRLREELAWSARFDLAASADDYRAWWVRHDELPGNGA